MKQSLITRKTFSSLSAMTIASLSFISFSNTVNAQEYQVAPGDTLWRVAQKYGVSVADLKSWNQLSSDTITINQTLIVTSPNATTTASSVESTNTNVAPTVTVPTTPPVVSASQTPPSSAQTNTTVATAQTDAIYTIQPGDSLYKIANQYNVTISDLQKWNNISGGLIHPNQKIIVGKRETTSTTPTQPATPPVVTPSTTRPATSTNTTVTPPKVTTTNTMYTIQPGDSLYKIATQYNVTISDLQKWNNISGGLIHPNQKIIVGKRETTSTTPAQPTTPPVVTPSTTRPTTGPNTTVTPPKVTMNKLYTVQPGDSLYRIASMYNVTISDLQKWNNISGGLIHPNQKIIVSKRETTSTTPAQPATPPVVTPSTTRPTTSTNTTVTPPKVTMNKLYTVQPGDSLYRIASMYNVTISDLQKWNNISGGLIHPNQKIIVSKQTSTNVPVTQPTTTTNQPATPTTNTTVSTYRVQSGDTLYKIAAQNGVSVTTLMEWNGLVNPIIHVGQQLTINPSKSSNGKTTKITTTRPTPSSSAAAVQAVLEQYKNSPVYVYYENLVDHSTAGLRENQAVYGASVPKILLAAYTQDRISRGLLNWDTQYMYTSAVNQRAESYEPYGSGTIQYDGFGSTYTVREIMRRTMQHSDNVGSNMLLHYVGYADKADFDRFVQSLTGQPRYSLKLTPKQVNNVMKYMSQQKEQYAFNALDHTDYDNTKLDVLPVNTHQKIGAWWPHYNHTTGIVKGEKPFALTVLSDYVSDSAIGKLVKQIYTAVTK
ncbi:LysM peptidoglycan-binding domain-containing protein [Aerococcaceae bacterium zg-BR9]|uniref:LysM peptidoglycan-binding domain-containing protein n=1 Tax=Aerococcaceae bacterium zg-1292 TaxID=2774330 RepID=UPI004062995F|nr:LysM peptidoglycan-binding domain-containing protein [Aerococcaceae bacterium zg-BR9]